MLVFSDIHDWQGDAGVKQILVFVSQEMKDLFDREIEERKTKYREQGLPEVEVPDSNAGAVFKLRAVKDSNGFWHPVIHCGVMGGALYDKGPGYGLAQDALRACIGNLNAILNTDLLRQSSLL